MLLVCLSGGARQVSCNFSCGAGSCEKAASDFPRWRAAWLQCPALLTVGFPVAGFSQKHPLLFEVLIGKADFILAAALSGSLCGVLPRAVTERKKVPAYFWHSCFHLKVTFKKFILQKKKKSGKGANAAHAATGARTTNTASRPGLRWCRIRRGELKPHLGQCATPDS